MIESHFELLALNKALMEVRYLGERVDDATRGSSFLSDLHTRLVGELIAYHEDRAETGQAEGWREWRRFSERTLERPRIVEYLSQMWNSLGSEELKRTVLVNQLQPFIYTQQEADDLYAELDQAASPNV